MAELQTIEKSTQMPVFLPERVSAVPEMLPQPGGAGPLWRSLVFPRRGQRALQLGGHGSNLFGFLRDAGVRFEESAGHPGPDGASGLDLVLEDRTNGCAPVRVDRIRPLLAPGGRWVVALEKKGWIGLAGHAIVRRARRDGFETIETYYAYPSLSAPRILVPLDAPDPFLYFLRLAVGVRAPRQRLLALGARCLCALRVHRMFLPNLIMIARRSL
jgi:hypothetical protein